MTDNPEQNSPPAHATTATTPDLMATVRDQALADRSRLPLMLQLDSHTLVEDLSAVATYLPLIATELRTRNLSRDRQHAVGALLIELGENLHQHADTHTPPTPRAVLEPRAANDSVPS